MDVTARDPAQEESLARRGFKTFLAAALGTAAVTALMLGANVAVGNSPEVLPMTLMGFVFAVHLGHEHLRGMLSGRGRFGVRDAFAREISRNAQAVARQEPGGAWVVLGDGGSSIRVYGQRGFERFAAACAKNGEVVRTLREVGDRLVVEPYEPGSRRAAAEIAPGALVYERDGTPVAPNAEQDKALVEGGKARGPGASPFGGAIRPGSDLFFEVEDACHRNAVHVRRGSTWHAFGAGHAEPQALSSRAYERARRTTRDHVEVLPVPGGYEVTRLTFGRLDSAAHGEPARIFYDAEGRRTGEEWYVEGKASDEESVYEAQAGYRTSPMVA